MTLHMFVNIQTRCVFVCELSDFRIEISPISHRKSESEMDYQGMAVIDEHSVCEGPARKESGKRGRKPGRKNAEKVDMKAKLERSRQSARECRARKKLRYQYLEELVTDREKAVFALRKELEQYHLWAKEIDSGRIPEGLHEVLEDLKLNQEHK